MTSKSFEVVHAVQPADTIVPKIYWGERKTEKAREEAKKSVKKVDKAREAMEKKEVKLEKKAMKSEKKAGFGKSESKGRDQSHQLIDEAIDRLLMPPPIGRPTQKKRPVLDCPKDALNQLKGEFKLVDKKLKKAKNPPERKQWIDHQAICLQRLEVIEMKMGLKKKGKKE